uniref:Uncharacterized protein n=1 Tax=Meloidogyne enterolobii TaxID=390850 RepID=A0A6V7U1N0_MELEN|nr:unnamed protein product [Meloidogyne enterolobii]
MPKSAILFILASIFKFSSSSDWVVDGVLECKENIHGLGEFSHLLQEAIIHFYERGRGHGGIGDPDDLLDGPVLTDIMGHFQVKAERGVYEMVTTPDPYLQIDHLCYTPTSKKPLRMGCYYRTIIDLGKSSKAINELKVHIILGMESARLISGKGKDLEIKTIENLHCPSK